MTHTHDIDEPLPRSLTGDPLTQEAQSIAAQIRRFSPDEEDPYDTLGELVAERDVAALWRILCSVSRVTCYACGAVAPDDFDYEFAYDPDDLICCAGGTPLDAEDADVPF